MAENQNLVNSFRETTTLTPLQDHFMEKLTRMLQQRQSYAAEPNHDPTLVKVLDRAIYVTYLDCLNQGIADLARRQVDQYRNPAVDAPTSPN